MRSPSLLLLLFPVALIALEVLSLSGVSAFALRPSYRPSAASSPIRCQQSFQRATSRVISNTANRPFPSSESALFSQSQEEDNSQEGLSTPLDNPALAALDIVALTGFAAVGKASHAPDGSIDLGAVLITAFPFITAWLATSPLTGVYQTLSNSDNNNNSSSSSSSVIPSALLQTVKGWAIAVPLGCALRGIIKGYVPPVPFVIVTLIATLVILSTVRVVYALATTNLDETS